MPIFYKKPSLSVGKNKSSVFMFNGDIKTCNMWSVNSKEVCKTSFLDYFGPQKTQKLTKNSYFDQKNIFVSCQYIFTILMPNGDIKLCKLWSAYSWFLAPKPSERLQYLKITSFPHFLNTLYFKKNRIWI